jgi:hypothetical protein
LIDAAKLKGRQVDICLYARPSNTYDEVAARGIDVRYAPQDVAGKTYRDYDILLFSARSLSPRTSRKDEVPACGVFFDYRCADRYLNMVLDPPINHDGNSKPNISVPQAICSRVAGILLHVRDSRREDSPPLIFLHGFGLSFHTWEPWARALSSDYRVIRFDMPGAGFSGPDPNGDYSDARSMQVLTALMDHFGIAKASLIGSLMGGKIAWKFAAAFPDRIDKLVLISPEVSPVLERNTASGNPSLRWWG